MEICLKKNDPSRPAFQNHSKSSEPTGIDPPYDFLLKFHSYNGPISYRFREKRRFQSKIAIFFHQPRAFNALDEGFLLKLAIGARGPKNSNDGATGPRKKFDDIFSSLDTIHEDDGGTDRRTERHQPTAKTALTHSVAR